MTAIGLSGVTKSYGQGRGVFALDLAVLEGEVFGFIGPNGAGKSTTIRVLMGLLQRDGGDARILGLDCADPLARAAVGYLPSEPRLSEGTVAQALADAGAFFAFDSRQRRTELCALFDLDVSRRCEELSLGNKKKVALVAALQHAPRVLILDEPTNGLDPLMQARLFDLLAAEQQRGTTVFFSSHVLSEVERVCSRVALLREGRLLEVARVDALRKDTIRHVRAVLPAGGRAAASMNLPGTTSVEQEGARISFSYTGPAPALLSALAADGVIDVVISEPTLEQIFMSRYGGQGAA